MSAKFQMLIVVVACICPTFLFAQDQQPAAGAQQTQQTTPTKAAAEEVPPESKVAEAGADFNQDFAFGHLKAICAIGPRVSATVGMSKQQKMLHKHFEALGAQVGYQNFNVSDPKTGRPAALSNLVVRFHPERKNRLLLCCHYDTRPFPDRDPVIRKAFSSALTMERLVRLSCVNLGATYQTWKDLLDSISFSSTAKNSFTLPGEIQCFSDRNTSLNSTLLEGGTSNTATPFWLT